jgi:hypothetical protein
MVIRRMIALLVGVSVLAACGGTDNGIDSAPATGAVDTTAPDTTAPDTTVPDTMAPDTTVPDTMAPDTTVPDTMAPDTMAPDTTAPDTTAPDTTAPDTSAPDTPGAGPDVVPLAGSIHESFLGEPYLGPLTYRVFPRCAVPVRETVEKNGATAKIEYRLRFTPEGDRIVMAWTDMEILTIDGMPVFDSSAEAAGVAFLMPEIVVDAAGRAVEVRGMADVIEQMDAIEPGVAEMLGSPQMLAALESRVVERYWYSWAGIWAEWGSFEEPIEEAAYIDEAGDQQTFTMTSMGTIGDELAAFSLFRVVEGDDLRETLGAATELVSGESLPGLAGADVRGQMTDTVEVVTDPTTLWPRSVVVERRVNATVDGESVSRKERRVSVLDWDASDCV